MTLQEMQTLRSLEKRLGETVFRWGNDLGVVKTQAYQECARKLGKLLDSFTRPERTLYEQMEAKGR